MAEKEIRLHCTKQLAIIAVYDIADTERADCRHDSVTDDITAQLSVFENVSRFMFSFDGDGDTVKLTVKMDEPAPNLSEEGQYRAVNYLADCVQQHLENEINKVRSLGNSQK